MIKSLRLKNFKAFEDQTIELRSLTLLTGLNGMGKSTVIQALLLLRQGTNITSMIEEFEIDLNGSLVQLGNASDVVFEGAKDDVVEIGVTFDPEITLFDEEEELMSQRFSASEYVWNFYVDKDKDVLIHTSTHEPHSQEYQDLYAQWKDLYEYPTASLFGDSGKDFTYLSAERIGPRKIYDIQSGDTFGSKGEYAIYQLYKLRDMRVESDVLHHPTLSIQSSRLVDQVQAWMEEISPGIRINLTFIKSIDSMQIHFAFTRGRDATKPYRATNVGFGISYTLPIIVAILSAKRGSLLIIENPEAHLHPKGQSMIGELMARAAAAGVQILCETHSDHIVNGIRIAVKKEIVPPDKVALHFFQRLEGEDGIVGVEVVTPELDRNGRLDFRPEGFFDEYSNSMSKLM